MYRVAKSTSGITATLYCGYIISLLIFTFGILLALLYSLQKFELGVRRRPGGGGGVIIGLRYAFNHTFM